MKFKEFYENEVYKDFQASDKPRLWQVFALEVIRKEELEGRSILDVGAGPGFILNQLTAKNLDRHALDLSKKCVSYLNEQGIIANEIDITSDTFPYRDSFFDYVIFTEVIEHLPFPEHTMSEIFRVLKPGGKLFISTHNTFNVYMRLRYLLGVLPTPELDVSNNGQHLRLYNYRILKNILSSSGFSCYVNKSWFSLKSLSFYVPDWLTPLLSRHLLLICTKGIN